MRIASESHQWLGRLGAIMAPIRRKAAAKGRAAAARVSGAAAVVPQPRVLHTIGPLVYGTVIARPSKINKSPYLADVLLDGGRQVMAHTPALGCGGIVAPDRRVALVARANVVQARADGADGQSRSSTHILHHALCTEPDGTSHWIGTHPQTANAIARTLLEDGLVVPGVHNIRSEITIGSSRFDFVAEGPNSEQVVIEVKNVSQAGYVDDVARATKKAEEAAAADPTACYSKLAIFPVGHRKRKAEPISERAVKHAQELAQLARAKDPGRVVVAVLLFVVQRRDVDRFCVSKLDPVYRSAVQEAIAAGVRVKAVSVAWDGPAASLARELPVVWD